MYRRNADTQLRHLQRIAASGDPDARQKLIQNLFRAGKQPYWIRVREITSHKDDIYEDEGMRKKDPNIPRWEDRGTSLDKRWHFYLHIPIREGTQMIIWLGEMNLFEASNGAYMQGCVESLRDRYTLDLWLDAELREHNRPNEIARINYALSSALIHEGRAGQTRAHFNTDVPLGWTPADPIEAVSTIALNWDPADRDAGEVDPYNRYAQKFRAGVGEPETVIPEGEFLVEDYLFNLFYEWMGHTQVEYGVRLRQACYPLDYQLPSVYQGRHVWLFYWKHQDYANKLLAKLGDYHPSRTVYGCAYAVNWMWGFNSRFYRWGNDAAHDNDGAPLNGLWTSEVVHEDKPETEHLAAQQQVWARARELVERKIKVMMEVAGRWGYQVILVEGQPPRHYEDPYRSSWMAGMQFPLTHAITDTTTGINYFR